ncbi:hypothetical protein [Rhodanobacter sp. Root480]|jgi:gamma-glutamylputrescine oxidase|uniref:FAD/NAD(P)-binding domain-containing protein n=1 Tax=Rhodanobacter ginsenosidimutans TaxID=490571 RepID=A0ABW0JSQ5_9GAMM|nr:hypothetical protein [Rhodanobacter sp. Root480]
MTRGLPPPSYYRDTAVLHAHAHALYATLQGRHEAKVVVVGGGYAG